MPETPDDILRSLADPERLSMAGLLARADTSPGELATTLGLSLEPASASTSTVWPQPVWCA